MGEGFKVQKGTPVFDTKTYLYKLGDECSGLTGGWGNQTFQPQGTHTFTKNTGNLTFVTNNTQQRVRTTNLINLTNYSKIYIKYSTTTNNPVDWNSITLGATTSTTAYTEPEVAKVNDTYYVTTQTDKVISIDISAVNASDYIAIHTLAAYSSITNTAVVTEVWLEV